MEKTISVPLAVLEAMQETLLDGSKSPSCAAWACGAVYVGIQSAITKGEMKNEAV